MLKNDLWIIEQAETGMIYPFCNEQVREIRTLPEDWAPTRKVISYGVSSYGYDLRLSPEEFFIFRHRPGQVVNPKNFDPGQVESAVLERDRFGEYFVIPGNSYGLGVALEELTVPDNITVLCMGKSTYARCGIIANLTPAEAGWRGHLTLEFSNASSADCRIYANEGVVQLLFLEGAPCDVTYSDRNGKYQGQQQEVVHARV